MGSKRPQKPPTTPSASSASEEEEGVPIPPKQKPKPSAGCSSDDSSDDHHELNKPRKEKKRVSAGGKVQRLWNDGDEILILKAMLSLKNKGIKPYSGPLFDSIKDSLRPGVTRAQLLRKTGELKKKYYKAVNKQDKEFFKLSHKLWGGYIYLDQSLTPPNFPQLSGPPPALVEFLRSKGVMPSSKAKGFDKRWRDVLIAQTKAYLQRLDLVRDQTQAMLDALDSSNEQTVVFF